MKRAIREHAVDFGAILGLFVVAAAVSLYILDQQRMRFPLIEEKPFILKGEFSTGQAVTPGQGQTVRVSGVRVGDIAKVELDEGKAILTFEVDQKYSKLVRQNWRGLLRPKTGLKDMFVELIPGPDRDAPVAKENWIMPVSHTLPDVNPDEFFASLDVDTRDYLRLLLNGAARGLDGRADDLSAVLKRFEPTYRDIALVSGEVKGRRGDLRRLITSLNRLNQELGDADDDLAQLVDSSATVFRQFAAERDNLRSTIAKLPSALEQTTDTLARVERMANVLGPASERLRPAVRELNRANEATIPFAREATPLIRRDIRPFVRDARPLLRELRPAAHDLVEAEPDVKRAVAALNGLFNLLAYNKDGREGPDDPDKDEGYLFYLAWLAHQSGSLFSGQDAHGVFRPLVTGGTCNTIRNTAATAPQAEFILGLTGLLKDPRICGETPGVGVPARRSAASQRGGDERDGE